MGAYIGLLLVMLEASVLVDSSNGWGNWGGSGNAGCGCEYGPTLGKWCCFPLIVAVSSPTRSDVLYFGLLLIGLQKAHVSGFSCWW